MWAANTWAASANEKVTCVCVCMCVCVCRHAAWMCVCVCSCMCHCVCMKVHTYSWYCVWKTVYICFLSLQQYLLDGRWCQVHICGQKWRALCENIVHWPGVPPGGGRQSSQWVRYSSFLLSSSTRHYFCLWGAKIFTNIHPALQLKAYFNCTRGHVAYT